MSYKSPLSSTTQYGIVKVGTGISVTDGVISGSTGLLNYGFFSGNTPQANPVANAINLVTLNVTGPANGISITGGNALTVVNAGTYTKLFTMNINKTSGGASALSIWLRYNGVDLPGSAQDLILTGALDTIFVSGNYTLDMAAGGNIQMCWSSADITMQLLELPARVAPVRPAGDSVKITLTRIS
jgi:hypothetical protein